MLILVSTEARLSDLDVFGEFLILSVLTCLLDRKHRNDHDVSLLYFLFPIWAVSIATALKVYKDSLRRYIQCLLRNTHCQGGCYEFSCSPAVQGSLHTCLVNVSK